jgi:hypothetical protein
VYRAVLFGGLSNDVISAGALGITTAQLVRINDLHSRTVHQENALSNRLATLQEDIANRPLLPIVRQRELATAARLGAAASGSCDGAARRWLRAARLGEPEPVLSRSLVTSIVHLYYSIRR